MRLWPSQGAGTKSTWVLDVKCHSDILGCLVQASIDKGRGMAQADLDPCLDPIGIHYKGQLTLMHSPQGLAST